MEKKRKFKVGDGLAAVAKEIAENADKY